MQRCDKYRANSWEEHIKAWKHPSLAWTIGLPFWLLQKVAAWYSQTRFSGALRILEPLGIAITIAALICTMVALNVAVDEVREARNARKEERSMRKASLLTLLYERLEEARRRDAGKLPGKKHIRAGQIPIFEEMVRLKLGLSFIDASGVNLTPNDRELIEIGAYGIRLSGASLYNAQLNCANLAGAQFVKAHLKKANFTDSFLLWASFAKAKLNRADFTNAQANNANFAYADLYGAIFQNTDISHASFLNAKGLSQKQLDSACAYEGASPSHLPIDNKTKEQLVWHQRDCPKASECRRLQR